ncbi:winged helix-turn-helix domain-containing protein [Plantactinospora sp. GCM10030261]
MLRAVRCLQLDPINAVVPSHLLVLWSRLGNFDRAHLDRLLWVDRWLFEYWAHAASIVLTEDYPLHAGTMRRYPGPSAYGTRVRQWLEANSKLRAHVLRRLAQAGPLPSGGFDDLAEVPWESTGWTGGRNVERMLEHLLLQGRVMVAGRTGRGRLWHLAEQCLSEEQRGPSLPDRVIVVRAAEHALRALGVASKAEIRRHFTRDRYPGLESALRELENAGRIVRVTVETIAEPMYAHADELGNTVWQPRTVVLSPFDNLVCDRDRTQRLWRFRFRNEMYQPRAKREFGYYVMPLLRGECLVGRIAARVDRRSRALTVEGLYAEPGAPADDACRHDLRQAIEGLAHFAGATGIAIAGPVASAWRGVLRGKEMPAGPTAAAL